MAAVMVAGGDDGDWRRSWHLRAMEGVGCRSDWIAMIDAVCSRYKYLRVMEKFLELEAFM